ncbi:MAG: 30S ribosomal protein S20 [Roseimicrobium sp.]
MPNIRSSEKDIRRTKTRTLLNRAWKTKVRALRKKVLAAVTAGDAKSAQEAYNDFASAADKAAKSNAIHKNKASRLKSRVAARLAKKD